jgi:hypothetical protein
MWRIHVEQARPARAGPGQPRIDRPDGPLLESLEAESPREARMAVRPPGATCQRVAHAFERLSGGFPAPPAAA